MLIWAGIEVCDAFSPSVGPCRRRRCAGLKSLCTKEGLAWLLSVVTLLVFCETNRKNILSQILWRVFMEFYSWAYVYDKFNTCAQSLCCASLFGGSGSMYPCLLLRILLRLFMKISLRAIGTRASPWNQKVHPSHLLPPFAQSDVKSCIIPNKAIESLARQSLTARRLDASRPPVCIVNVQNCLGLISHYKANFHTGVSLNMKRVKLEPNMAKPRLSVQGVGMTNRKKSKGEW